MGTLQRTFHDIGGLIEGVQVRSAHHHVAVCRRGDGALIAASGRVEPLDGGAGSWPLVRGVVCQLRQMYPPFEPHDWAVSVSEGGVAAAGAGEEREAPPMHGGTYRHAPATDAIVARTELPPRRGSLFRSLFNGLWWVLMMLALPQVLAAWALGLAGAEVKLTSATFQIVTGLMWPAWFIGYNLLLRRLAGFRRLHQYNTAAFQVLVAHEKGSPLTVSAVRRQSPLHPFSAANYISAMMLLLPAVFYLAARPLAAGEGGGFARHAAFVALKVAATPVMFSLAYEIQRVAARLFAAGYLGWAWPILCVMQRLWTLEPDDGQIEVAIVAAQEAIALEAEQGSK